MLNSVVEYSRMHVARHKCRTLKLEKKGTRRHVCAVEAYFVLCLHLQIQVMQDHTYILSSEIKREERDGATST